MNKKCTATASEQKAMHFKISLLVVFRVERDKNLKIHNKQQQQYLENRAALQEASKINHLFLLSYCSPYSSTYDLYLSFVLTT